MQENVIEEGDIIHCDDCPEPCEEKVMAKYDSDGMWWCHMNEGE